MGWLGGAIRFGEHGREGAVATVGDELYGSVEHIEVAITNRRGLDGLEVAPCARLGQRQRCSPLARHHVRKKPSLQLLGGELLENVGHQQVRIEYSRKA